jgi:hypothetical protein
MKKYLFVGERRSELAKKMNVTWVDRRLAAAHLSKAVENIGIKWDECTFLNVFEDDINDIKSLMGLLLEWAEKSRKNLKSTKLSMNSFIIPQPEGVSET